MSCHDRRGGRGAGGHEQRRMKACHRRAPQYAPPRTPRNTNGIRSPIPWSYTTMNSGTKKPPTTALSSIIRTRVTTFTSARSPRINSRCAGGGALCGITPMHSCYAPHSSDASDLRAVGDGKDDSRNSLRKRAAPNRSRPARRETG